ncbi:hypothetical protein AKJ09_05834 [Labilithrix luteola]|uniref:Uncharacterized protein n=1 Tax=Labilithrix luteola TaxID=1391654 RepID=A0A0K1Q060_9BACT|nr:hypothetical protein [Labilithrix luteola]AKU99170.1 hypothetical protein AKJ09_05834 [Labilithrix luteola]
MERDDDASSRAHGNDSNRGNRGDDGGTPRKRPLLVRLLRFTLIACASLFALYVVAINVFLSTSLFDKVVNATPDTIDIHFERGWSIVPSHIHAKKLSIRGRDSNVEWRLTLDEVAFEVSFSSFLKQRFAASNVHGKGISFRLRQRLDAPPSSPEEVEGLAPIAGFPPYSVRPPKEPSPEMWSDADYHLWTAHLEGVVAEDVREVWIDRTRFEGLARIEGRFYLKPLRAVEVGPVHVTAFGGQVSTGKHLVAEAFEGSGLDVTIGRFDPRPGMGGDLVHRLTIACDAHATLPGRVGLPTAVALTLHGPVEIRRAAVHVSSGRLDRDSHLVVNVPKVVLISGDHRVSGSLALDAEVAPAPTDGLNQLNFRAEMTEVEASHEGNGKGARSPLFRASKVLATGDSRELDLAHPFEDLHLVVELPEGDVANVRELSRYIPPRAPVSLVDGHAKAAVHFEAWLAEKRATATGVLRAENLELGIAKMRVRGSVSLRTSLASYHFDTRRLDGVTMVVKVSDGTLASATAPDTGLVRVNEAELVAQAPVVALDDPLRAFRVSISMPSADVLSQGLLHAYLPKGSEMQIARSRSRFSLTCNVVIAQHLAKGTLDIQSRELTVTYRDLRLDAHVHSHASVHDWQWETGDLTIDDARVDVENLTIAKVAARDPRAAPAMSIARIGVGAKSTRFEFDDPLAKIAMSASFEDAKVHDFSAINAFLPEKATFRLEGNNAAFDASIDLEVERHFAKGAFRARASDMGIGGKMMHLRGNVALFAKVEEWDLENNTMRLLGSSAELTRVSGRFGPPGPPALSAERLALDTSNPRFDVARPSLSGGDYHLVVEKAELPDARALSPLLPPDSVVGIESGAARVAADVTVSSSRRTANGGFEIALSDAGLRLHETHLSGDIRFLARVAGFDPERDALDLSGTHLEMRRVAVEGGRAATQNWRADLVFSRASLQMSPAVVLDGVVRLDARDARPLLAILLGNNVSRLVVDLTDMPHLAASVRLISTSHELALLDLDARGGNLALRGSFAVRDHHSLGAVIAAKGPFSVGIARDDGGTHVRFFGLDAWLRPRECAVAQLVEVGSSACPTASPAGSASRSESEANAKAKAKANK